jgi:hypothetical protein
MRWRPMWPRSRGRASPYRNLYGTLTGVALAGQGFFQRAVVGCARCHAPPNYTDSRLPAEPASGTHGFGLLGISSRSQMVYGRKAQAIAARARYNYR